MSIFDGYRISSNFGNRRHPDGSGVKFHTGIDLVKLSGGVNAPIEAFTDGVVLFAGEGKAGSGFGGYGNVVLLKDKDNRGHVYAHLHSVSVKKGQAVKKGQVIGRQGNTGKSFGAHLHYEVRKKAEDKVPYGWIADRPNNCFDPTDYLNKLNAPKKTVSKVTVIHNIQSTLNTRYGAKLKEDGIYGPLTEKALVKALQVELNKAYKAGLVVDGIPGPKTYAAIRTVKKGDRNNIVWIVQAMFYVAGSDPKGVDGIFGGNTEDAAKDFQGKKKLKKDGIPGKQTITALLKAL